jgi:hypothetical protein
MTAANIRCEISMKQGLTNGKLIVILTGDARHSYRGGRHGR